MGLDVKGRWTTKEQVSAGGVVFRDGREVALILVEHGRWHLPKGLVPSSETPEAAAIREVREETGLTAELVAPLETTEYWYASKRQGIRFHKFVHFYLFRYLSGDVADHDHEVLEARWVTADQAADLLSFENERNVLAKARHLIEQGLTDASP